MKSIFEAKVLFIARLNELSPGTFFLYFRGNDSLTMICYIIMHTVMYGYYLYVGVYAYLRHSRADLLKKNQTTVRSINQALNLLFTLYWWIFLTPYVEINSAIISCNPNSFFVFMRNAEADCSNISLLYPIFGYVGLFLACVTGFITMFLFRSHEFSEKDALRRKFRWITFYVFICRVLVTYVYYRNSPSLIWLKEVIMNLITLLMVIDCIIYRPYSNHFVYKSYMTALASFGVCMLIFSLFISFTFLQEDQLAYYMILFSAVCAGALISQ